MALLLLMTCLRFLLLLTGGRVFLDSYLQFAIIKISSEIGEKDTVWREER
jgi:hypothetical protein